MTVLIAIYVLFGLLLYIFQRHLLYFPTPKITHAYNTMQLAIDEGVLEVIVLNGGKPDAIVYFGGNGESVVGNAASFSEVFANHAVYLVNYRGYGGSSGAPTEAALYADAQHLYDTISPGYGEIAVIGRSLGSGVATFLASTRRIGKMILITPYNSIENMAQNRYPIFPISLLLKDKFNSASRIRDIDSATLIILAEYDTVIPAKYSHLLIREFPPSQLTVEVIEDVGHNSLSGSNKYYTLLQQFM